MNERNMVLKRDSIYNISSACVGSLLGVYCRIMDLCEGQKALNYLVVLVLGIECGVD